MTNAHRKFRAWKDQNVKTHDQLRWKRLWAQSPSHGHKTTQVIGSMANHDNMTSYWLEKVTQATGASSFTGLSFFLKWRLAFLSDEPHIWNNGIQFIAKVISYSSIYLVLVQSRNQTWSMILDAAEENAESCSRSARPLCTLAMRGMTVRGCVGGEINWFFLHPSLWLRLVKCTKQRNI